MTPTHEFASSAVEGAVVAATAISLKVLPVNVQVAGNDRLIGNSFLHSAGYGSRLAAHAIRYEFKRAPVLHLMLRYKGIDDPDSADCGLLPASLAPLATLPLAVAGTRSISR